MGWNAFRAYLKNVCDNRSRLTAMTGNGKTTTYSYDDAGRRTNAVWPNGVTASYEYDAAGQLLDLEHLSGAHPLASFEYGYDLSGSRTNMVTLEGTNSYAYDARNWLTTASYPDGRTEEFGYDPVGNRMHLGGSGSTQTDYTYGPANRLLSSESASATNTYAYDAAGRLTNHAVNGNSRVFEYSFRSQMTSLTDTNGQVFTYAFDGDGNRISQSLNDCLSARYVYDGPNAVLELNASNEVIHAVVNGPGIDQPVERIAYVNGAPRLRQVYHTDGLGSVALMTDESKNPVKTYAYDAFGRIRSETGELVMNRLTYTGREALGDSTGLYYYRWRVMDPNTGRFISEDPLGFVDGLNRYGYVGNDPINGIDIWGLYNKCKCDKWLEKAKNEDRSWLDELPACPCTEAAAKSDGWTQDGAFARTEHFHPGATACFRSSAKTSGGSKQQCCYDSTGALITNGAGAGTPDKSSGRDHVKDDIGPWNDCGWEIYNSDLRPPNNKNGCSKNP